MPIPEMVNNAVVMLLFGNQDEGIGPPWLQRV